MICLAVIKKKVQFNETHKQVSKGQQRSRGQPKKTKSALNLQNDYYSATSSESESSDPDTYTSPVKKIEKSQPKKRGPKPKKNLNKKANNN